MFIVRHRGRATLRVLILASAAALVVGVAIAAGNAMAAPTHSETAAARLIRNDRLSVEVVGAGPDVVLIPGFGCSREVWRATADRLKATHRVHLVQLAGFAGEPWSHGEGAFVDPEVEALAAYVKDAGLKSPAVIGHSMGGLSALLLAQRHPETVGRVMAVDNLPFFSALFGPQATVESARPFAAQAAAQILNADDASFRAGQVATAEGMSKSPATREAMVAWTMASDRQAMAAAIRDVMTTDARPGLAAMRVPVTALYAADADGGAPAAMADALWAREYAALPGVKLIRVDGSRHFIMADQPEVFAGLVDEFLK